MVSPLLVTSGAVFFREEADTEVRCFSVDLPPETVALVSVILPLSGTLVVCNCTVVLLVLLLDNGDGDKGKAGEVLARPPPPHDAGAVAGVSGTPLFARLLAPSVVKTCCDGPALGAVEELRGCQPGKGEEVVD